MQLERALAAIDHAGTQEEVLSVLRAFVRDPVGSTALASAEIEGADDVAEIAFELARLRASTMSTDLGLVLAEALFARASMKMAALLDCTGAWVAYKARTGTSGTASPDGG